MRFTLACAWCRKAKVKCQHDGHSPCRACSQSLTNRECVLTYPPITTRHRSSNVRGRMRQPLRRRVVDIRAEESSPHGQSSQQVDVPPAHDLLGNLPIHDEPQLDAALVDAACRSLVQQFPEFGFIHPPTFLQKLQSGLVSPLKSCAIVVLSSRNKDLSLDASISEQCVNFTRRRVMTQALDRPDVETVQALVMLSLFEWGNGRGYQSWMYLGMAIRMGEIIISGPKSPTGEQDFLHQETVHRTLWACFVMNCILSGGKGRKDSFRLEPIPFPLPASDDDFTFQTCPRDETFLTRYVHLSTQASQTEPEPGKFGSQFYLNLVIRGIDIWSAVTKWASEGGRHNDPENVTACPWNEDSTWNRALSALNRWAVEWAPNLVYTRSNNNMRAFVLRQNGPAFAMINLLYHVTIVYLHREYMPFLPHRVDRPVGPIDPPILPKTHPCGWWKNSAEAMYDSAVKIVHIVQDLEYNEVQLRTPLVGFWVYTACLALQYGCSWPHMAVRNSDELQSNFDWGISWLHKSGQNWEICKGWINTVDNLQLLYDAIKQDPARYLSVGRDNFVELEDNAQRLSEVDAASASASAESAHMLMALSQSTMEPQVPRPIGSPGRQAGLADLHALNDSNPVDHRTGAEGMDEIISAWFADQNAVTALIRQPMPDLFPEFPLNLQ